MENDSNILKEDRKLSSEMVIEDLKEYVNYVLDLDPVLYAYKTIDELIAKIKSDPNSDETLAALARVQKREGFKAYLQHFDEISKAKTKEAEKFINELAYKRQDGNVTDKPSPAYRYFYRGQYNGGYALKSGVYRKGNREREDFFYLES